MPEHDKAIRQWSIAFILGALASLFLSLKPPTRKSATTETPRGNNRKKENDTEELPLLSPKTPATPETSENACKCCHHKTPRWKIALEFATVFLSLLTLIALIFYARDTHKIWEESVKSADAAKTSADSAAKTFRITNKITESQNEAVLEVRPEPSIGQNREWIRLANIGRVNAEKVSCHVEIARKSLPSLKTLAVLGTFAFDEPEILSSKSADRTFEISLTDRDRQRIMGREETIVTNVTLRYDNGFDTIKNEEFCSAIIYRRDYNSFDSPYCRDIPIRLKDLIKQEQYDREQQQKQNQKH